MREIEIRISPQDLEDQKALHNHIAKAVRVSADQLPAFRIIRKSLDARKRPPVYQLRVLVSDGDPLPVITHELDGLPNVSQSKEVHIIGAGPAGYFAALECIKEGYRPIVYDRGKDVQARRKDLRAIQQEGIVNPHSNYCFGEGGAGTYSDGKLYTRSGKRGNIQRVLQILVECGADPDIMIEAHPHIGSNKLPPLIAHMRAVIEEHGGSVVFNAHVTDIHFSDHKRITGLEINGNERIKSDAIILATGHSARDIFTLLH
ncbi:MAG TPA: FAD-binding protein, partial [Saprospiraceae bacterium]|nr:FAD-binding protein [Saprospiraceae bacterium]